MKSLGLLLLTLLIGLGLATFFRKVFPTNSANKLVSSASNHLPTTVFSLENAPSQALQGTIASMSGKINWQSRIATEPGVLNPNTPIQQGEKIVTEEGKISLKFGQNVGLNISPNTEIDIAQTLPVNLVFEQKSGSVEYQNTSNSPLSVRNLHLLIQQPTGNMIISVSQDQSILTIQPIKNPLLIAYNDTDNISTVKTINPGSLATFNDQKRQLKITVSK